MEIAIEQIKNALAAKRVRISDHADEEAQADQLELDEIYFSVSNGEFIEQYPNDKAYPRCLFSGHNLDGAPIHSVWACNELKQWAVLITV